MSNDTGSKKATGVWQPPLNDDGSLIGLPVSLEEASKHAPRCDVCKLLTVSIPCSFVYQWGKDEKTKSQTQQYVYTYCSDPSRWTPVSPHHACEAHRKLRRDIDNLWEVKLRRVLRVMRAAWEGRLVRSKGAEQ